MAVDVDVDNEATLLFVVDKPVDSDEIPVDVEVDNDAMELFADDRPVEVEVDSEVTVLFVVDRPVDNELIPVDVDVDKLLIAVFVANNCEPLIASVLVAVTRPAATFVICRSAPGAPTLTTLAGVVPA
ncbi:hypothetical protein Bsp3421_000890 [Burkholderia sp. FERM BP-3421]|nr:hypothetical protein [Burkholderia sp. FERM BP-3421]WDD91001.1 hypothetical protein Bsp3421_000890 [Burkholderia sp. FERM BP-3421]